VSEFRPNLRSMTEWESIMSAVALALTGDKDRGRAALVSCWDGTSGVEHAQRCVIAHYLADLQPSLEDEVAWDEVALSEHAHVTDEDLAPLGMQSAAHLAASLHLNLGEGYLRQGRVAAAGVQLAAGLDACGALPTDGYGALIRSGLDRLQHRIGEVASH
jgi:hypothetical protein